MDKKKRKATIDDGMNPELVKGADFDGYLGIPMIKNLSSSLFLPILCLSQKENGQIVQTLQLVSTKWIGNLQKC